MNDTNTPDHGEPWRVMPYANGGIGTRDARPVIESLSLCHRAIACVNACAGQDPAKMRQTLDRFNEWHALTNAGLSLRLGELTAQEVRTVRAVLNAIKGE